MLIIKKVRLFSDEYKKVRKLLKKDFSKKDRFPMFLLYLLSIRKNVEFNAYYDDDQFVGFMYGVQNVEDYFVLYLAIDPKVQSKGYGSSLIEDLKKRYPGYQVILNAEAPNSDDPQSIRRIRFYAQNGINETGYCFVDRNEKYCVLSSKTTFKPEHYTECLKILSYGQYKVDIEKYDLSI